MALVVLAAQEYKMNDVERAALWRQMSQLFDNDIAPYMEFQS